MASTADGPKRPMRADALRNYNQLLAQAGEAFGRHGVDASLEDIARAAGVGIGTLYRHFPTRDALLLALLSDRFERARQRAGELLTMADPAAALASFLRDFVRGSSVYRGLPDSVTLVWDDPSSQLYASCHGMQEAAARLLARAQQAGQVRTDVAATDVFLMAAACGWAGERAPGDPELVDRLLGLMLDGLRVPAGSADTERD